jgi:DNA-binding IclR family transcriptional regulator
MAVSSSRVPMPMPAGRSPGKAPRGARVASAAAPVAKAQRGIQSIEVGGRLLQALAGDGRPMALKDLARQAGMTPAKAHPYLVSFGVLGLIAQHAGTGRYGLGPLATQLGLISLQQVDPVRLAMPVIAALAQELDLTVAIAVWGNRGATVVRIEEPPSAVHVNMRHGTVMSLRGTASGLLFAAFMGERDVVAALAAEATGPAATRRGARIDAALAARLARVRGQGVACVEGGVLPGVSAMAAPVFDSQGGIALGLTAIGPSAVLDLGADGPVSRALRREARALSSLLGAPPPASGPGR